MKYIAQDHPASQRQSRGPPQGVWLQSLCFQSPYHTASARPRVGDILVSSATNLPFWDRDCWRSALFPREFFIFWNFWKQHFSLTLMLFCCFQEKWHRGKSGWERGERDEVWDRPTEAVKSDRREPKGWGCGLTAVASTRDAERLSRERAGGMDAFTRSGQYLPPRPSAGAPPCLPGAEWWGERGGKWITWHPCIFSS